jgi:hypothetical protein
VGRRWLIGLSREDIHLDTDDPEQSKRFEDAARELGADRQARLSTAP